MLEIHTSLSHIDEKQAICSVTARSKNSSVTVYASALAVEGPNYAELAQVRALVKAKKMLERGWDALEENAEIKILAAGKKLSALKRQKVTTTPAAGNSTTAPADALSQVVTPQSIPLAASPSSPSQEPQTNIGENRQKIEVNW